MLECEYALDLGKSAVEQQADTIEALIEQNKRLERSLDYAASKLIEATPWYKRPEWVAPISFVSGVALGAWVVNKAR